MEAEDIAASINSVVATTMLEEVQSLIDPVCQEGRQRVGINTTAFTHTFVYFVSLCILPLRVLGTKKD